MIEPWIFIFTTFTWGIISVFTFLLGRKHGRTMGIIEGMVYMEKTIEELIRKKEKNDDSIKILKEEKKELDSKEAELQETLDQMQKWG
jgi:hypothetical protein